MTAAEEAEIVRACIEGLTEGLRVAAETQRKHTECIKMLNDRISALEKLLATPPPEVPRRRVFGPRIHGI